MKRSEMAPEKSGFCNWRRTFWPVHRNELVKFLPMFFMLFLICFNYSVIRNMKDALVVTAKSSGAEVIPFIKVWAMLPGAILGTWIYTRLSNRYSQERVFYLMLSAFLIYFALFIWVFYPNHHLFHPHQSADLLQEFLPSGFKGFIAMYRHWTFTLFYVISELWGCIVLNILFWGFANQVTSLSEAKRFYAMFHVGSNLGTITAGQTSVFFCKTCAETPVAMVEDAWGTSLTSLLTIVIAAGVLVMCIFRWVNKYGRLDPWIHESPGEHKESDSKKKHSLRDSFSILAGSKYLICIAVIVVSYNLVINLVEVVWKDRLRQLYPDPNQFNTYMNYVTTMVGVISTCGAFAMSWIIRTQGWRFTALIAPLVLLFSSAAFFLFLFLQDSLGVVTVGLMSVSPLAIVVFCGAIQNCLSKACKYSVFDATKEMSFIPLSHEMKMRGKAAIDGVGSRLGKSGGSLIHQALLVLFTSLTVSAPYVAALLLAVIVAWIYAVRSLGDKFNALTQGRTEPIVATPSPILTAAPTQ